MSSLCFQTIWIIFTLVCIKTSPCLLVSMRMASASTVNASWSTVLCFCALIFFIYLDFFFHHQLHFDDFTPRQIKNTLAANCCSEKVTDNRVSLAYKTGSRCLWKKNDQGSAPFRSWPCNVIKRRFVQMAVIQSLKDKISSRFL